MGESALRLGQPHTHRSNILLSKAQLDSQALTHLLNLKRADQISYGLLSGLVEALPHPVLTPGRGVGMETISFLLDRLSSTTLEHIYIDVHSGLDYQLVREARSKMTVQEVSVEQREKDFFCNNARLLKLLNDCCL